MARHIAVPDGRTHRTGDKKPMSAKCPAPIQKVVYGGEVISDAVAEERIARGADCIFELREDESIHGRGWTTRCAMQFNARKKPNYFVLREADKI